MLKKKLPRNSLLASLLIVLLLALFDIFLFSPTFTTDFYTNIHFYESNEKVVPEKINYISKNDDKKSLLSVPVSYDHIISIISKKYNIEPSLVHAVIKVESNWDTKAISRSGAIGLMQLMPATARAMGIENPYNPEENIEAGIRYLRHLLDRFNGDLILAIAAYNVGPRRVKKFQGIPPIRETQHYVKKVLSIYNGKNPVDERPIPSI
jgi:soluble lytic murein transglycosylase-like protein